MNKYVMTSLLCLSFSASVLSWGGGYGDEGRFETYEERRKHREQELESREKKSKKAKSIVGNDLNMSYEEIKEAVEAFRPVLKKRYEQQMEDAHKRKLEKVKADFDRMNPDEKAVLIQHINKTSK